MAGRGRRGRAREIAQAHATFLSTGMLDVGSMPIRDVVAGSWLRSTQAHVDPDADPPVTLLDDDLAGYRSAHPLSAVLPVLRDHYQQTKNLLVSYSPKALGFF
ncbi:hypothetical protein [Phytohabitans rumicis]|uniref:Uncharacterized protein n=1 Tax=Phytohabitans rumicis TaxID=1076125 RepID=A0A6V8LF43_9ACTN|nr:hypothetical protein [Phytohabitans rumicis]GFJ95843.1 hypothetical protein Prum_094850 [Phytohabitans rumicis]